MSIRLNLPNGAWVAVDGVRVAGRLPSCDVVLDDAAAAERHFAIAPAPGGAEVCDLGSAAGTFVDGERVDGPRHVTGGEEIAVGAERLVVEHVVETKPADLCLTVRAGPDAGAVAPLVEGRPLTIGRAPEAGLALHDPRVAPHHCLVALVRPPAGPCPHCGTEAAAGAAHCVGCGRLRVAAEVEDLGATTGTLVDGAPLGPHGRADLLEGGEIHVGDSLIAFGSPSDPVPAHPHAPAGLAAPAPRHRRRRTWLAAAVVLAALAVPVAVLLVRSGTSAEAPAPPRDAAAVMRTESRTAVQLFACDDSTPTSCDLSLRRGSGSVIDLAEGLVLTNFHVIADPSAAQPLPALKVGVSITGERVADAEVVGFSACDDLALIRIAEDVASFRLEQVTLADPATIEVGEEVVVLGYPGTSATTASGDEQLQLTTGSVSALGVTFENYADLIQTDAAVNRGNSGGPLFDLDGRQIGVATLGDASNTQGIHYAINVAQVAKVLPSLKAGTRQAGLMGCAG